jgi:CubicO group peptidase (beta-lactamase class C family)
MPMPSPTGFWWLRLAALLAHTPAAAQTAGQSFDELDDVVRRGIRQGIYPGAVVVVGRRDSIVYARGYGHFTWKATSPVPDPDSTVWDIASITKVVGTASAVMRLVDSGRLSLDAPVHRYLPRFSGGAKDRVTVRMLLDHTSGLRSYAPLFQRARTREGAINALYAEPVMRTPGESPVYSDLNAIVLGLVIESASGLPLDEYVTREVFTPLGMTQTTYRTTAAVARRTVPTALWRGHPVQGRVNDPNADVLGGAAGHAGIFSTGMDLARYAQAWLRNGAGPAGQWVKPATIRTFLQRSANSGPRLLGWDTAEHGGKEPSVFGSLISDAGYGHTGFTGTEIWIDPARDLFLVFLTNRTFDPRPRDSQHALRRVRASLSDAAIRLVPSVCQQELVSQC